MEHFKDCFAGTRKKGYIFPNQMGLAKRTVFHYSNNASAKREQEKKYSKLKSGTFEARFLSVKNRWHIAQNNYCEREA